MTENGCAVADDDVNVAKNDKFRVEFYQGQKGFENCFSQRRRARVFGIS